MSKEPLLAKVRSTEEERIASFLFCSLQNDRGLNFLYLDEESSLRICLINAGPSSYQTMTNTEPDRRARIVIDLSKAGDQVRLGAPPDPVPGFEVIVDESAPIITLVQSAYYWSWFAGEYVAINLPSLTVSGANGSGDVTVTMTNIEGGINSQFSTVLMRLRKTGSPALTRAGWKYSNAVTRQDDGIHGTLRKDSNNVLKLTLTHAGGFFQPEYNTGSYPSFYVMLADGYSPGYSALIPPYNAREIEASTPDASAWDVTNVSASGYPVWKLTPNKLNLGDSNLIELKLSNILSPSIDRGDVVVYHLGVSDQVDMYQVMQVATVLRAAGAEDFSSIQIVSFTATPDTLNNINTPTQVLLSWNVQNAGFVTLSEFGVVDAIVTNQAVKVEQTTNFVLTAFSASLAQAISKTVQVRVNPSIASRVMPQKTIMMWSGDLASIPAGWVVCDGNNGTPNLSDRFVMGAGKTAPNSLGDATTHTHSIQKLSNSFTTANGGYHTHGMPSGWYARGLSCGKWSGIDAGSNMNANTRTSPDGNHTHSVAVNFPAFNSGVNNTTYRPAWFALYFIMKTGV